MSEYWFFYVLAIVAFGFAFLKYSQRNDLPEPPVKKQMAPLKKNMTLE
mgnify:FL=1|jgi:hypothetical protein